MEKSINRGSEWNIWDLHIHTPASFHWKDGPQFRKMTDAQKKESCRKIIEKINSSEPIAFCIVDYFTFDGILEIRKFLKDQFNLLKKEKTIFPGIELRVEAPTNYRLNVQVIFNENITDQELKDFQAELKIFNIDKNLSDEAIKEAAKKLPEDKAKYIGCREYKNDDDVAYKLGCETILITRKSFEEAVKNLGKEKCLVILPYETSGGVEKLNWKNHPFEDIHYLQSADFFESRKQEYIDLFLGKKHSKNERFFDNFQQSIGGKSKPVLSGSDAHKIEDYGQFPHEKKTWLKAEPTFKGLKQVIVEPESRCFIGKEPKKLRFVEENSTKFISKLDIKKRSDSGLQEKWFDNEIHFNTELVAVIGNKGSGKSALTDILGLLGNSKQYDSFSFLNDKKFKERNGRKAKNFQATLYWKNQDKKEKSLNEGKDPIAIEAVRYIPQSYLEKLCNELDSKENSFYKELKKVIFSHMPDDKRLGRSDLDSLLKFKTEEIEKEKSSFREQLRGITNKIIENRKKISEEYKNGLENKLLEKQRELEAIEKSKPEEVSKPDVQNRSPEVAKSIKELEKLKQEHENITKEIELLNSQINVISVKQATLNKAISQIRILKQETQQRVEEINKLLKSIDHTGIKFITFNEEEIQKLEKESKELKNDLNEKRKQLDESLPESLGFRKNKIQEQIKLCSEKIDEPNKKYQQYLFDIKRWKDKVSSIKGDENDPMTDTIIYLKTKIQEIQEIPQEIENLEKQRDDLVKKIHQKIMGLVQVYKEFYNPIQNFIEQKLFDDNNFKVSFKVEVVDNGFKNKFFDLIDRGKRGTFYGVDSSEKILEKLLDSYNFNEPEQILQFVHEAFNHLEEDRRDGNEIKENRFETQILAKHSPEILYNMIFGLEYLEPKYFLQLNEKNIEQLSPGERGILLLVFYLIVDKDDRPLILDQPEENLDNQTIYKVLVPCIKKAKNRRQIFLVTHNPNLAVVCDAEQIITASIDKKKGNTVNYHSGAIENSETNQKIVDILEGTQPAFENRKDKYHKINTWR